MWLKDATGLILIILIQHIKKTYSVGQKKKPSNLVEGQVEGLSYKELQFYYNRLV